MLSPRAWRAGGPSVTSAQTGARGRGARCPPGHLGRAPRAPVPRRVLCACSAQPGRAIAGPPLCLAAVPWLPHRNSPEPGLPGGGARAAHPPLLTSSPSLRCTLSEAPLPWPSRIAAAHSLPPRAQPDRCCKADRCCTHRASQAGCSPPQEPPSVAAPGDPAPPSSPPMATATPPRRLGPQLTAGRTRPATPKSHCARLARAGGLVSLRCRPTPARGMLGCVVRLPAGSRTVVPGAPRAGRCHCAETGAAMWHRPGPSRPDAACRSVYLCHSVQGQLSSKMELSEPKQLILNSTRFGLGACTFFNSGCQILINRTGHGTHELFWVRAWSFNPRPPALAVSALQSCSHSSVGEGQIEHRDEFKPRRLVGQAKRSRRWREEILKSQGYPWPHKKGEATLSQTNTLASLDGKFVCTVSKEKLELSPQPLTGQDLLLPCPGQGSLTSPVVF